MKIINDLSSRSIDPLNETYEKFFQIWSHKAANISNDLIEYTIKKQFQFNDPYKNITKAFIVLQSNFQILYGDILERDFLQNVKTGDLQIIKYINENLFIYLLKLYKFFQ